MNLLYTVNPAKRRRRTKGRKSRKHRSAAQRAATARMLAANRSKRGGKVTRSRRRFRRNPSQFVARAQQHASRGFSMLKTSGIVGLLKSGVVMGAGAVAVDIGMGYTARLLPASMANPVNADGSANFAYVGTKTALALLLGIYGRRLPVVGPYAGQMAEGALAVLAYSMLRPMVPQSVALGYLNPTPTFRPAQRTAGVGKYVSRYESLPVRANGGADAGTSRGSNAAQVVNILSRRQR